MKYLCLVLILCFSLCLGMPAMAWDDNRHELICALAESKLSPQAAIWVANIMKNGKELDSGSGPSSFAASCTWPDDVKYASYKGSYESHFINLPDGASHIVLARDCPALDCIFAGIQRSLTYLSQLPSGRRERTRQAAALRFTGHLVGDLHQPLHVSQEKDRGGNLIRLDWYGEETNLHRVWDHYLPEKSGLIHSRSVDILRATPFKDKRVDLLSWGNESWSLAVNHAYVSADGKALTNGTSLGKSYFIRSKPIIHEQLVKAGNRLALLLNLLASGQKINPLSLSPSHQTDESGER